MSIRYKIDILNNLKLLGYTTYKLRKGQLISWENINTICRLLNCQPGDILEYVEE